MSGRTNVDYKEAERRFVIEEQSIRQIAADMGLRSWSSMAKIAKREDWAGKRAAYHSAIARRSYEHAAEGVAGERSDIQREAILAGRATIRQYLKDLSEGKVHVNPRDAQLWAAFLMSELAEVAGPSTEAPDARNVTPPDTDLLRRVVEAARGRVAPTGSLGAAPLVVAPDPRPN